jgi:hypothetical protein
MRERSDVIKGLRNGRERHTRQGRRTRSSAVFVSSRLSSLLVSSSSLVSSSTVCAGAVRNGAVRCRDHLTVGLERHRRWVMASSTHTHTTLVQSSLRDIFPTTLWLDQLEQRPNLSAPRELLPRLSPPLSLPLRGARPLHWTDTAEPGADGPPAHLLCFDLPAPRIGCSLTPFIVHRRRLIAPSEKRKEIWSHNDQRNQTPVAVRR